MRSRVVGSSTRLLYGKAVEPFMEKMLKLNVNIDDLGALDCALEKEMTHTFFQGSRLPHSSGMLLGSLGETRESHDR